MSIFVRATSILIKVFFFDVVYTNTIYEAYFTSVAGYRVWQLIITVIKNLLRLQELPEFPQLPKDEKIKNVCSRLDGEKKTCRLYSDHFTRDYFKRNFQFSSPLRISIGYVLKIFGSDLNPIQSRLFEVSQAKGGGGGGWGIPPPPYLSYFFIRT